MLKKKCELRKARILFTQHTTLLVISRISENDIEKFILKDVDSPSSLERPWPTHEKNWQSEFSSERVTLH